MIEKENSDPFSGVLFSSSFPPKFCTSKLEIASPKPDPPNFLVIDTSA